MTTPSINGLPVACNRDCGATCALVARQAGSDVRLSANPLSHPLKKPCPRGLRSIESRNAPDRLLRPLIRTGERGSGEFSEVSWETALSEVASRLSRVIERDGAEAVMSAGGSGSCKGALHNTGRLTARFMNLLGPVTNLVGNYSFQAAGFIRPFVFGSNSAAFDMRTLVDTRFVILWGANVSDTRFGNETEQVIRHIKRSGGDVIVIDPRKSRTASQLGTEWIPIRPSTDTAAMLAIAWVLFDEGLTDSGFIETHVHGADEVCSYVSGSSDGTPKTPEWAEAICGIPAKAIRSLAHRYAAARPAALLPGFSIQRAIGGEDAYRMSLVLQALSGNTGRAGGSPGTCPWFGLPGPTVPRLGVGRHTGSELPKLIWPRAVLGGTREGYAADVRAGYFVGCNYLNQGSDVNQNVRAIESLELVVCHEIFMTPTARFADIVLPVSHFLEREDVITPEDNYLYYSAKVFDHPGEVKDDFDVFADLSRMLGKGEGFTEGVDKSGWVNRVIDGSAVTSAGRAEFKRTGVHDGGDHDRYALSDFIADPVVHRLTTPSGKIEVSSSAYEAETGYPAWPVYRSPWPAAGDSEREAVDDPTRYPALQMITPHSRYRINSTGSNIDWIKKSDPVELWIHPEDAQARGLANGDSVRVRGESGELQTTARITDDIMPGVVCLPQGGWSGTAAGPSANQVTSLEPTQPSGGTRTHTVFVEVQSL